MFRILQMAVEESGSLLYSLYEPARGVGQPRNIQKNPVCPLYPSLLELDHSRQFKRYRLSRLCSQGIYIRRFYIGAISMGEKWDAELLATSEALDIALKIANPRTPITICSDSQKALRAIALTPFYISRESVCAKSSVPKDGKTFSEPGHLIPFQWIPSHSGILGNEKVDAAAKK